MKWTYVTGSFGRIEAGKNSDLDVFIVGRTTSSCTSKAIADDADPPIVLA